MPNCKPHESLKLGLNVLVETSCEGCRWHEFPYKVQNICSLLKKNEVEFNNTNDVWSYIDLLIEESEQIKPGSRGSALKNIAEQLPFFVCNNHILDSKCQEDIAKYIYIKETNTPAYKGSYGDTPRVWIQKYYIIKKALMIREKQLQEEYNKQHGNK